MTDLSEAGRQFMGALFAIGSNPVVRSHEPHKVLTQHRAAYDECRAAGLLTEQPFNNHGSIEIRATPAGLEIAQAVMRERIRAEFGNGAAQPAEGCR